MKRVLLLLLGAVAFTQSYAQASVGVSIGIQQPGVYGRIDIGNYPPPQLMYPQPIVVIPSPIAVQRQPIYLYVPQGHQRDWPRFCNRYAACGQPVYFVEERWVQERYQERYQERRDLYRYDRGERGDRGNHGRGHGRKDKRNDD